MITFRPTRTEDLPRIMELVAQAQAWFRQAEIDQWQDGYPTLTIFHNDLLTGQSYVGEEGREILLSGCISFAGEPTYAHIYEGEWLDQAPYAVVHRLVVDAAHKGERLAEYFLDFADSLCRERKIGSIRIDTHTDNRSMLRLLHRCGFIPCGRIVLESGANRQAFQRLVKAKE